MTAIPAISVTAAKHGRRSLSLGTLRLVREPAPFDAETPAKVPIHAPKDVYEFMRPFAATEPNETFWMLALNAQRNVIGAAPVVISRGIVNASLVHPRDVFRPAIVAGALAIIVAHNHPSGDPTPSADDRLITEQLRAAGRLLDIEMQDHVVIGDGRYVSFAEAGLL